MGNFKQKENNKMVKQLKTLAEFDEIKSASADKLVVIDFTATWCPPCQMIGPKFVAMAEEFGDAVIMVKIDVDENAEAAQAAGIEAMPTFQFFKGGAKIDQIRGANEPGLREPSTSTSEQ